LLGAVDFSPFRIIRLPEPDLNICCFLVQHPSLAGLRELNALNEAIYRELSPGEKMEAPYIISRTRLTSPAYDGALAPLLATLSTGSSTDLEGVGEGLTVLRVTVMNPFADDEPDHLIGLLEAVRAAAARAMSTASHVGGAASYSDRSPIFSAKST
jgi:hypothetical protein